MYYLQLYRAIYLHPKIINSIRHESVSRISEGNLIEIFNGFNKLALNFNSKETAIELEGNRLGGTIYSLISFIVTNIHFK